MVSYLVYIKNSRLNPCHLNSLIHFIDAAFYQSDRECFHHEQLHLHKRKKHVNIIGKYNIRIGVMSGGMMSIFQ